ncbi:MAG: hypothetical protein AAF798_21035 [Bacteroidota bacterium]
MKKILLYSLALMLTSSWLFGQTPDGNLKDLYSVNQLANLNPKSTGFPTFSNVNRVKGSPYLFEEWRQGQIQARGGNMLGEQLNLAVDLDNHVLYAQLNEDKYGDIPIEKIQMFTLTDDNKTYWFEVHDLSREFGIGPRGMKYYEVLHNGPNYLVLHYHDKYLRKESHVENLGMVRRPDKFMSLHEYYVYNGKKLIQVKKSSKSLRNALPKEAKTIKKLIKKHDLKVKKEDDFVKLFILLDEGT